MSASTLSHLSPGSIATIERMGVGGSVGEKLLEMGLTPGTRLRMVQRSSRGGPLRIRLRGYTLSLGASEADGIWVLPC